MRRKWSTPFADLLLRHPEGRADVLFGVCVCVSVCLLIGPVLRDTARLSRRYPTLARYGVLVSQHGQLGAIPPPPFLGVSSLESMRSGCAIPPPPHKRSISAILGRYHMKARLKGCDAPLCDTISKRYCAIWGASRIGALALSICVIGFICFTNGQRCHVWGSLGPWGGWWVCCTGSDMSNIEHNQWTSSTKLKTVLSYMA